MIKSVTETPFFPNSFEQVSQGDYVTCLELCDRPPTYLSSEQQVLLRKTWQIAINSFPKMMEHAESIWQSQTKQGFFGPIEKNEEGLVVVYLNTVEDIGVALRKKMERYIKYLHAVPIHKARNLYLKLFTVALMGKDRSLEYAETESLTQIITLKSINKSFFEILDLIGVIEKVIHQPFFRIASLELKLQVIEFKSYYLKKWTEANSKADALHEKLSRIFNLNNIIVDKANCTVTAPAGVLSGIFIATRTSFPDLHNLQICASLRARYAHLVQHVLMGPEFHKKTVPPLTEFCFIAEEMSGRTVVNRSTEANILYAVRDIESFAGHMFNKFMDLINSSSRIKGVKIISCLEASTSKFEFRGEYIYRNEFKNELFPHSLGTAATEAKSEITLSLLDPSTIEVEITAAQNLKFSPFIEEDEINTMVQGVNSRYKPRLVKDSFKESFHILLDELDVIIRQNEIEYDVLEEFKEKFLFTWKACLETDKNAVYLYKVFPLVFSLLDRIRDEGGANDTVNAERFEKFVKKLTRISISKEELESVLLKIMEPSEPFTHASFHFAVHYALVNELELWYNKAGQHYFSTLEILLTQYQQLWNQMTKETRRLKALSILNPLSLLFTLKDFVRSSDIDFVDKSILRNLLDEIIKGCIGCFAHQDQIESRKRVLETSTYNKFILLECAYHQICDNFTELCQKRILEPFLVGTLIVKFQLIWTTMVLIQETNPDYLKQILQQQNPIEHFKYLLERISAEWTAVEKKNTCMHSLEKIVKNLELELDKIR